MSQKQFRSLLINATAILSVFLFSATTTNAADPPSAKLSLSLRPVQKVAIDTPAEADFPKCKVKIESNKKGAGWVVYGPQGQILRRFVDTNRDGVVDTWRYYQNGLEVYRDVDSDFNKKVDQSRWINIGGTRWGIDSNEDGSIDSWKQISAEEASREAVLALAQRDVKRLQAVLLSSENLKGLGIAAEAEKKLAASLSDLSQQIKKNGANLDSKTKWVRFDSSMLMPNLIPKEEGRFSKDLLVYENVMAITQVGTESEKTGFIRIGEMVRVGNTWKLTQVPIPLTGNTMEVADAGFLMQPEISNPLSNANVPQIDPKVRKLLDDLRAHDASPPVAKGAEAMIAYNRKRIEILNGLVGLAKTPEERKQWLQQMIDGISAAVQTGSYPPGVGQLKSIEKQITKASPNSEMVPYTAYRSLLAQYSTQLHSEAATNKERQKVHDWWLENLQSFVKKYPQSADAGDALLQLGIATEFVGEIDDAKKWYQKLAESNLKTPHAERARGALKRLTMKGKPIAFSGQQWGRKDVKIDVRSFQGGPLLIVYWATWSQATEDLPQLLKLHEQYQKKGFRILGVNVDSQEKVIAPYVQKHRIPWAHIYEPGGLESPPAKAFGIISVPTMFLLDAKGKVVNRAVSIEELKKELPNLVK